MHAAEARLLHVKASPVPRRSKRKSWMILLSTWMLSSGRLRSRSAWLYAENKPLQLLGVPLVPPRCGIWAQRHHAEMTFMNELWVAVVPPPSAPTSFLMLLPKASTSLSGAKALDLSGRLVKA